MAFSKTSYQFCFVFFHQMTLQQMQIQQKRCDDWGDTTIAAEADLKVCKGRRDWHKKAHFGAVRRPLQESYGWREWKWLWQTKRRGAESRRLIDVDSTANRAGQPASTSPLSPVMHCVITSRLSDWWNMHFCPTATPGLHFCSDYSVWDNELLHKSVSSQPMQRNKNETQKLLVLSVFIMPVQYQNLSSSFCSLSLIPKVKWWMKLSNLIWSINGHNYSLIMTVRSVMDRVNSH